ncbi:MAG: FAD-binding protein [Clostridia bacterium]|nr:FAD-binding protein [Clostridia bacterium]
MVKVAVLLTFYNGEISPFEQSALECALEIKNAQVTVISMSPLTEKERLEYFTRLGVKAVLISDNAYAGSDTLATSKILARYFTLNKYDLIMCGRQSLRGDTAQVPAELSVMLGYDFYPYVMKFGIKKVRTRLGDFNLNLSAVISVEKIKTLRLASVFSQKTPAEVIDNSVLKLADKEIGFNGSPTKVLTTFKNQREKKKCEFVGWNEFDETLKKCIKSTKPVKAADYKTEKFDKVFYVHKDVKSVAESIAKTAAELKAKGVDLADEIIRRKANIVLFPADLHYRALAPQIAVRLNAGLCADCIKLEKSGERLIMYRPALGGDTIAKIVSESRYQLATVRTQKQSGEIVFGIGYGALKNIDKIKALAIKYGAETVLSRKAVDNSDMDYGLQVGLTGRIIAPKVYVAFGISGAIQHIVGIENAEKIIAVNSDKTASIFDYADYGIVADIKEIKNIMRR